MRWLLALGVIVFSGLAAMAWFISSVAWVSAATRDQPREDGFHDEQIIDDNENDVLATAARQVWWNRWAAGFACLAAVCQAAYAYLFGLT